MLNSVRLLDDAFYESNANCVKDMHDDEAKVVVGVPAFTGRGNLPWESQVCFPG